MVNLKGFYLKVSNPHHASECVLHRRVLSVFEHSFEQQGILCDPLMGFGLHVSKTHPIALRMILYPLERTKKHKNINSTWCFQNKTDSLTTKFLKTIQLSSRLIVIMQNLCSFASVQHNSGCYVTKQQAFNFNSMGSRKKINYSAI